MAERWVLFSKYLPLFYIDKYKNKCYNFLAKAQVLFAFAYLPEVNLYRSFYIDV